MDSRPGAARARRVYPRPVWAELAFLALIANNPYLRRIQKRRGPAAVG